MISKDKLGTMAALAANLIFGFSFIFSKLALNVAHPIIILLVRFMLAFAFMGILALLGAVPIRLKGKKKGKLIAMAVAQPLLYFIFELYGLELTSSALSGIIISLVPVAVTAASAMLGERPSAMQWVCTAVSIAGVSVISVLQSTGGSTSTAGIVLLCLAVASAATFNLLSRGCAEQFSAAERTFCMFAIGSVGFAIIAVGALRGEFVNLLLSACSNWTFWLAECYLALLSSVCAFLLYNYSTSNISVIRSASFSNIITVVSVVAGVTLLREPFSPLQFALSGVIILAVWGVNTFTAKNKGALTDVNEG